VDRAILRVLRSDGRITVTELAARVSISRANAYARLERLAADGVIDGYQVRINPRAVGLDVAALIFLTIEQAQWRDVRARLLEIPEVEFVAFATGDFDFIVLVRAMNPDELRDVVLERFLALPGIRKTQTVLLLDDIDRGPIIPDGPDAPRDAKTTRARRRT
jgi:DNA-binding Lrp family transcriptional regulator